LRTDAQHREGVVLLGHANACRQFPHSSSQRLFPAFAETCHLCEGEATLLADGNAGRGKSGLRGNG